MEKKGEVFGLEQAICFFVSFLQQRIFNTTEFEKVWISSQGFKYIVSMNERLSARVLIYPAGWPFGSYISAGFFSTPNTNWRPYEGSFIAPHIAVPSTMNGSAIFEFKVDGHPERLLNFEPQSVNDVVFVNALNMFTKL